MSPKRLQKGPKLSPVLLFVITISHGRREGPRGLHGTQAALAAAQQPPRQEAAVLGQLVVAPLRGLRRRVSDELEDAFQRRGVVFCVIFGPYE